MSLYGLDLLVDKEGNNHLLEINGVHSGMSGFKEVYGDSRVEDKVYGMLTEKHGKITVNVGSYLHDKELEEFKKNHPIKAIIKKPFSRLMKVPGMRIPALSFMLVLDTITPMYGEKRLIPKNLQNRRHFPTGSYGWLREQKSNTKRLEYPFPLYEGEESTVINVVNEQLPHPLVNSYVQEEISRNKFLQYLILKDTEVGKLLPRSVLVRLGATDEKELEQILKGASSFIVKPILGSNGMGIQRYSRKETGEKFRGTRGPLREPTIFDSILEFCKGKTNLKYLEDLIDKNQFSFEEGLEVLQPFVNTEGKNYSVVRAIVCNGNYVDAYQRVSNDYKVNLSRGAKAKAFKKRGFGSLCEEIVSTFEKQSAKLKPDSFRSVLYNQFLDERGRTSKETRSLDAIKVLRDELFAPIALATLSKKISG